MIAILHGCKRAAADQISHHTTQKNLYKMKIYFFLWFLLNKGIFLSYQQTYIIKHVEGNGTAIIELDLSDPFLKMILGQLSKVMGTYWRVSTWPQSVLGGWKWLC